MLPDQASSVQASSVQASSVLASSVQARTVASITLRATIGRKRAILFALPPLILVLVTALLKAGHAHGDWPSAILGSFGLAVVLPLTALIIGTSVLGAEIDDGSVVHLLATPVPRSTVILSKFAVATALTMLFAAVPEFLAGLIAAGGPGRLAAGLFAGALAGSVIYNAVFVMISALTIRAIAVGLLYLLVWESLLSNVVSGVRVLSVEQYSLGIANSIARNGNLNAHLGVATAAVMGALVTVVALGLAIRRLAAFSLKGDAV
jgi:ABC-2 type transport system permease protein